MEVSRKEYSLQKFSRLSKAEKDAFELEGFIKIKGLLPKEYADKIIDEAWDELDETFRIKREEKATWRTPSHALRKTKYSATNTKLITEGFRNIISELLGHSNWLEPSSWGGFLVDFPDYSKVDYRLHEKMWHWDYELSHPTPDGLLIFSFFSKVGPKGGGTLLISGSHRLLENYRAGLSESALLQRHSVQRKQLLKYHPYFQEIQSHKYDERSRTDIFMNQPWMFEDISLQVVELCGDLGDVVFCHPRIIHAPSGINNSDHPRIMRSKFLW